MKVKIFKRGKEEIVELALRSYYGDEIDSVMVCVVDEKGMMIDSGALVRIDERGVYRFRDIDDSLGFDLTCQGHLFGLDK